MRGSAAHTEVTNEGSAANLGNWSGRRSQCRSNGFGGDNGRAQDCLSAGDQVGTGPALDSARRAGCGPLRRSGKEGLFSLRLKLPKDYAIPPHTHPKPEVVTVISGTFRLGMGEKADKSNCQALPAGSFFALSPGLAHFAFSDEDTVIQLNNTGPWGRPCGNPADDPRKK